MRIAVKRLCWFLVVLMFYAVMSGGCGGGNSSLDGGSGNGWDFDPQPNNNNQGEQGQTPGTPTTPNNGGQTGGNGTPVAITGTWEIVSGRAITSQDNGRVSRLHFVPGRMDVIGIEMRKNDQAFGGQYADRYSVILSGANVIGSGYPGSSMMVDFAFDDNPQDTSRLLFASNIAFRYIGGGSYEVTDEDLDSTGALSVVFFRSTFTLIDDTHLRWTYWTTENKAKIGDLDIEGYQELNFQRAR